MLSPLAHVYCIMDIFLQWHPMALTIPKKNEAFLGPDIRDTGVHFPWT